MFDTICHNIINDLTTLDAFIKELRCELESKTLYAKHALSLIFNKDIDEEAMSRIIVNQTIILSCNKKSENQCYVNLMCKFQLVIDFILKI